jgi:hypothetical protein
MITELNSYDRAHVAPKARNIYCQSYRQKRLPIPTLEGETVFLGKFPFLQSSSYLSLHFNCMKVKYIVSLASKKQTKSPLPAE